MKTSKMLKLISVYVIPLIALAISLRSCNVAEDAKKTGEEALEISKQEIRPYIQLRPTKLEDKNSYLDIKEYKDGFVLLIMLEVVNKGKIPANKISYKGIVEMIEPGVVDLTGGNRFRITSKQPITLVPGDSIYLRMEADFKSHFKERGKAIDNIMSNMQHFLVKTTVYYSSALDSSYKSFTAVYEIARNRADLIKSENDQDFAEFSVGEPFLFKIK